MNLSNTDSLQSSGGLNPKNNKNAANLPMLTLRLELMNGVTSASVLSAKNASGLMSPVIPPKEQMTQPLSCLSSKHISTN